MIKAIIFDCFGVLITDALSEIVAELRKSDSQKADHIVSLIKAAHTGIVDSQVTHTEVAAALGLTREAYAATIKKGEVRNEPLLRYIARLKETFKTALLSNINKGGLDVRFPNDELKHYFDVVVTSSDIGFAKPDAQAYEITADTLGVRLEECVMIDDSENYCQAAVGVGMHAIHYTSFEQMKDALGKMAP